MAADSQGTQALKYALFLFNLLILILSIVVISSAGVLLGRFGDYGIGETMETPRASCILLIIVGTVALIISFLGCCGAVKESYQLLYTYGTVLFILFIVEIMSAVAIFAFRNDIKAESIKGFKEKMKNYKWDNNTYNVIDDIQMNLKCCGAEKVTDWSDIPPYDAKLPIAYPPSCCLPEKTPILSDKCLAPHMYTRPCWEAIEETLHQSAKTLANTSIAIAVIQFLAMLASCVLARTYKKEYDVV
ncbi:CD63 antigen [Halotydeus destructor]|nr:CD63 antigen [Halotydeus destructor]